MPIAYQNIRYICRSCLRAQQHARSRISVFGTRHFTPSPPTSNNDTLLPGEPVNGKEEEQQGAMSRRLSQLSEDSLEAGGSGARKAIQEAGFDEELKRKLEERIAGANFRNHYASVLAQSELPSSAGKGTRDIAGARGWDGSESLEDTALRMLTDAHKPMRVPSRTPTIRAPTRVDTGRSKHKPSSGARLANARDRTSIYSTMKEASMTEQECEQFRKEMKERFAPNARSLPASTVQGLASLANERIEDAIARGQFKNLPRGKKIERDYNASSPFLDTTEYLLNKMIQRQDIVPPWIEKQQELVSTATKFRSRLRNEWKRHAARMISATGGSLNSQIRRAEEHAAAEAIENPPKRKEESFATVDTHGHMSQITLAGDLKVIPDAKVSGTSTEARIEVRETPLSSGISEQTSTTADITIAQNDTVTIPSPTTTRNAGGRRPFRDPQWESNELSFHQLTISELNSLTRSYNLIAPQIAQKPYFNLGRELRACYADVAPLLANEIRERATRPRIKVEVRSSKGAGMLEKAFERPTARVYDENLEVKGYGFKQFWSDLWKKDPA